MAATTLPRSFHSQATTVDGYDEFAVAGTTPSKVSPSWDEEIVPALRKRLEEESRRLEKRLSRLDEQPNFGRTTGKRMVHGDNEILQDGLGDDDLIPSEWATGSKAQFTAMTPRVRGHAEDRYRSASAQQYPSSSQIIRRQASLLPPSPTSSRASPDISSPSLLQDPTFYGGSSSVSRARERARMLAREKERLTDSPQPEDHQDGTGGDTKSSNSQRSRTLSTPTAHQPVMQRQPLGAISSNDSSTLRSKSREGLKEDDNMLSSRIPLPVSGSMSKLQTQSQDVQRNEVRRIKSSSRMSPPHQDGAHRMPQSNELGELESERKRGPASKGARQFVPDPAHTQDPLSDFGPLGGSPRARQGPGWPVEGVSEDGMRLRTTSTPWDEEMLPTVKKRLAQQKLMEGLSKDHDFVDTWDRNGLPLSKSHVVMKPRASNGRTVSHSEVADSGQQQPSQHDMADSEESDAEERLKRLQEQLEIGMGSSNDGYGRKHRLAGSPRKSHEMQQWSRGEQIPPTPAAAPQRSEDSRQKGRSDLARHEVPAAPPQSNPPLEHRAQEDAGCCQCVVI